MLLQALSSSAITHAQPLAVLPQVVLVIGQTPVRAKNPARYTLLFRYCNIDAVVEIALEFIS